MFELAHRRYTTQGIDAFYHRIVGVVEINQSTKMTAGVSGGGTGLFSRISSFFVGAGMSALLGEFFIFKVIREGNVTMLKKQKELEKRIAALEKKK